MRTKKAALAMPLVCAVSFTALPATWAGERGEKEVQKLYQQCQERLKKSPNAEAKKLCDEGLKLQRQGKEDEAIENLTKGLKRIGG